MEVLIHSVSSVINLCFVSVRPTILFPRQMIFVKIFYVISRTEYIESSNGTGTFIDKLLCALVRQTNFQTSKIRYGIKITTDLEGVSEWDNCYVRAKCMLGVLLYCTIYIRETLGKTYHLNAQSFPIPQKNQVLCVGDRGRSADVIT